MSYDEIVRVRLESSLKDSLREKSGGNMSDYMRGLLLRDLGFCDSVKPLNVVKKDIVRVPLLDDSDEKRLNADRLQKMVDDFKAKSKR